MKSTANSIARCATHASKLITLSAFIPQDATCTGVSHFLARPVDEHANVDMFT